MNVLVLMGGTSAEREISLKTGTGIAAALRERGHRVLAGDPGTGRLVSGERLALADAGGEPGLEVPGVGAGLDPHAILAEHSQAIIRASEAARVDVVFIALHGGAGEDGRLQALLELAGKAFTGSGHLASGLAMDKVLAKRLFVWAGVPTPEWVDCSVVDARAWAGSSGGRGSGGETRPLLPGAESGIAPPALAELGGLPIVVKPVDQGSTIGVTVVHAWRDFGAAVEAAAPFGDRILIERYIPGREIAVGILGDRALPAVEIEPTRDVYDYECKYTKGMSRYTCPARLDPETTLRVEQAALSAFRVLGCSDFARVDIRLAPDGSPYVLEVNTIPGMTETSLLPMAARTAGLSYAELVERMCELALARAAARAQGSPAAPVGASGRGE